MNNDIHLAMYHRRTEIHIMRLVGATPNFIRLPYLLEAMWMSFGALLMSYGAFFLLMKTMFLPDIDVFAPQISIPFFWLLALEALFLTLLTMVSSFTAVEKHLKRHMVLA
jgi:cell division transport system permease protein